MGTVFACGDRERLIVGIGSKCLIRIAGGGADDQVSVSYRQMLIEGVFIEGVFIEGVFIEGVFIELERG